MLVVPLELFMRDGPNAAWQVPLLPSNSEYFEFCITNDMYLVYHVSCTCMPIVAQHWKGEGRPGEVGVSMATCLGNVVFGFLGSDPFL